MGEGPDRGMRALSKLAVYMLKHEASMRPFRQSLQHPFALLGHCGSTRFEHMAVQEIPGQIKSDDDILWARRRIGLQKPRQPQHFWPK